MLSTVKSTAFVVLSLLSAHVSAIPTESENGLGAKSFEPRRAVVPAERKWMILHPNGGSVNLDIFSDFNCQNYVLTFDINFGDGETIFGPVRDYIWESVAYQGPDNANLMGMCQQGYGCDFVYEITQTVGACSNGVSHIDKIRIDS